MLLIMKLSRLSHTFFAPKQKFPPKIKKTTKLSLLEKNNTNLTIELAVKKLSSIRLVFFV